MAKMNTDTAKIGEQLAEVLNNYDAGGKMLPN